MDWLSILNTGSSIFVNATGGIKNVIDILHSLGLA
ncbi:hypothetical protein DFR76_108154 [Nocardia pseudobrasiliensis]|uniref:Uncharacterized protein n=1 Tax=Nocardia pseudobrasiliensis TaxID=45979 RepID=A0A370I0P6_9NOCA|nr:hypothetical protein DFR76_108154 [Nocardia pseudobrasiliensis]